MGYFKYGRKNMVLETDRIVTLFTTYIPLGKFLSL